MLREAVLALARHPQAEDVLTRLPITSGIVTRFVPGASLEEAVAAAARLVAEGCAVSLDHLGEQTVDETQAERNVQAYLALLERLAERGLARQVEVSLKLSAVGQALPDVGPTVSLDNARRICEAARRVGTTVTVDMEDHTTTDATLSAVHELRKDYPETGAVLQASLYRTESDCRALAYDGSRVRLCKGAYDEPAEVAFTRREDIDKSFVRCLKILMSGAGYPMVATHDPQLIRIATALATRFARMPGSYEVQMLYGVRPAEQRRLASTGERVRVYLPYGREWYSYLMRRLAERPANLTFFLRSLLSTK